jgi:hypothetical protein
VDYDFFSPGENDLPVAIYSMMTYFVISTYASRKVFIYYFESVAASPISILFFTPLEEGK